MWLAESQDIRGSNCCCYCSLTKSCPTLHDPMNCSTPGFPVPHHFPEFAQTHVHCGKGSGNTLQYSCLENPMDGGVWWATVHGVAKSWTLLSTFTSLHPVSHRGYNILHSHQKCAMFIISTHSLRHLLSLFCFDNSQSGKCEVTFHCGYHLHFLDD